MWDDDIDAHIMQQTFFTFQSRPHSRRVESDGVDQKESQLADSQQKRELKNWEFQFPFRWRYGDSFLFFLQTFSQASSSSQHTKKRKLSTMTFQLIILKWISHCTFIVCATLVCGEEEDEAVCLFACAVKTYEKVRISGGDEEGKRREQLCTLCLKRRERLSWKES